MQDGTTAYYYASPLGTIEIIGDDDALCSVLFMDNKKTKNKKPVPESVKECIVQLDDYFSGKRKQFDLPLQFNGTDFQVSVWDELQNIPYGKTISYTELAMRIADEKSVRAVGAANGRNPVVIIVPCHRVIGMNHKLVGYGGGLWRKQWLLEHEQKFENGVLRLF